MDPKKIRTGEPFEGLFPIDNAILTAVTDHMRENGYDSAQPVVLWKEKDLLIDGHTRVLAAVSLKIPDIPTVRAPFDSEDEAVEYAIHAQRDRRNVSQADIFRWVGEVDKRRKQGERTDLASIEAKLVTGKSAEHTAQIVGVSKATVERARTVLDHADEETKAAVLAGEKSIHKAYVETQAKRKPVKDRFNRADAKTYSLKDLDSQPDFRKAYEDLEREIMRAKANEWKTVSKETARHFIDNLLAIIEF